MDLPITVVTRSSNENVSGTIASDNTWTNDKTYIVVGDVGVAPGVTLTIQAGTTVKFNGNYSLNVGGTLVADGTQSQPIRFLSNTGNQWGRILFDNSSVDATADTNGAYQAGNLLHWVQVEKASGGIDCTNATPYLSHVTIDGGGINCTPGATTLWIQDSTLAGGLTVSGNGQVWRNSMTSGSINVSGQATLMSNQLSNGNITVGSSAIVMTNTLQGGGISMGSGSTANRNNIEDAAGWGISSSGSVTVTYNRVVGSANGVSLTSGIMQGNLIANSSSVGLQVNGGDLISNTLVGNGGNSLVISGGAPVIHGNNLEFNKGTYDIVNNTANSIDVSGNWWGTTSSTIIDQRIFDYYDVYTKGIVDYDAAASGPIQSAPAYVRHVTVLPDAILGIQTGKFEVEFSRAMDTSIAPVMTLFDSDRWATRASMPTIRHSLGVAAATNGKIYAIGGLGADGDLNTVEEYNPATNTWTARTSMPTGRSYLGAVAAPNGKIYAIGGNNYGIVLTTVEEYDPAMDTWKARAPMPTARDSLGVVVAPNGKIYTIGGKNHGNVFTTVEEYDPATNTWTGRVSMPTARFDLGVAAAPNGKIYAIGGMNQSHYYFNTVEEYDPATNTWTARAPMPTVRFELGAATAQNGKIYAIGGWHYDALNTVEEYDPATNTWTTRAPMPTARSWLGVEAAPNGKIYAIGGFMGPLSTVEEYTPPFSGTAFYNGQWFLPDLFEAYYDITSLIPRSTYTITVNDAIGGDGIETPPNSDYSFTVDYAGGISDVTQPEAPIVNACSSTSQDILSASWSAYDPDSSITMYSYAIGTTEGGSDVVNWINTTNTSFLRSGLGLISGGKYYISVKARNTGGLWSEAGTPPAVIAGQAKCTTNASYGVLVSPASDAQSGNPGGAVTYQLTVTNTSNMLENFDVGVSAGWMVDAPATVGPMAIGAYTTINVVVHIPARTAEEVTDTATITITSQGDPTKSDVSTLTTTVAWPKIYLPKVIRT